MLETDLTDLMWLSKTTAPYQHKGSKAMDFLPNLSVVVVAMQITILGLLIKKVMSRKLLIPATSPLVVKLVRLEMLPM